MTASGGAPGLIADKSLRQLVGDFPGVIWIVDRELRMQEAYGADLGSLGLTPDAIRGRPLEEIVEESDADVLSAHHSALAGESAGYQFTFRGRSRRSRVRPLRGSAGQVEGVVGVSVDVSGLQDAERLSAEFGAIVQSSGDAIIGKTLDGTITSWNPGAERIYGYTADEIIGRSISTIIPPELDAELGPILARAARGESTSNLITTRTRKDGVRINVAVTVSPILSRDGTVMGASTIARDITPLITAREALERSEETYRQLFERHPSPMWLYDPDTLRFLAVNESALATYGYDRDEFLAMTIADIRPEEDREALHAVIGNTERERGLAISRHRRKDGTLIDVQVESNWIDFEGRRVRLVLAQDVTEQRRLEAQLRQSQKMEAIGSLAGGVAHDFNNVLLVIRGLSGLLANELDGAARDRALEIDVAAQRAAEVTQQLLAFSRQQILRPEVVDLTAVLEETLSLVRRLFGENVEIATALAPDLAPVLIDRAQLQQVILNLLVNARDAMAANGGVLTVRTGFVELDHGYAATAADVTPGDYVVLEVTDTGAGMDESTRLRIFDPFFTTKETGTGLGLATVFGIVKQSGGHIAVYSELRIGSTFRVYLRPAREAPKAQPQPPDVDADTLTGTETILLVEDADAVRQLVLELLEPLGYTVLAAASGEEALELARSAPRPVDLLLTDVVMPRMNGRELAERLLEQFPAVKVLFTSGYPADTMVRHGIAEEDVAFIQKPYSADELMLTIRRTLSRP